MKAYEVLESSVASLKESTAIDHWQRDRERIGAEDLLRHALGVAEYRPDLEVSPGARRRYDRMIARRASGEPVQLIKGYAIFRGLEILASPASSSRVTRPNTLRSKRFDACASAANRSPWISRPAA